MSRADRFTFTKATPVIYSDFTINIDRNPQTGSLVEVTNEAAVNQRLRNIILIKPMELPYSRLGSRVANMLFDLIDNYHDTKSLEDEIIGAIKTFDPSVDNVRVNVKYSPDDHNAVEVTVIYDITNIIQDAQFTTLVRRVR